MYIIKKNVGNVGQGFIAAVVVMQIPIMRTMILVKHIRSVVKWKRKELNVPYLYWQI